jgi:hypothetical protein
MALKDIILNAKYPDDMQIALPDGTSLTVGEMRSFEAEEKQRLITRSQTMEAAETALAERIMEAQRRGILTPVAPPLEEQEIRREAAAQFGLREDDPLLGQVAKEFKRMEAERKAEVDSLRASFKTEVDALKGITGKVTGAYLDDYYDARFQVASAALPQAIREKTKLEAVINYAKENNMMDKLGRYKIDEAIDRMTWSERKEAILATERAELKKNSEREAQLATMNRPSPNALRSRHKAVEGFDPMTKEGKVKSFDEALADAASDDSMWDALSQTVQ